MWWISEFDIWIWCAASIISFDPLVNILQTFEIKTQVVKKSKKLCFLFFFPCLQLDEVEFCPFFHVCLLPGSCRLHCTEPYVNGSVYIDLATPKRRCQKVLSSLEQIHFPSLFLNQKELIAVNHCSGLSFQYRCNQNNLSWFPATSITYWALASVIARCPLWNGIVSLVEISI